MTKIILILILFFTTVLQSNSQSSSVQSKESSWEFEAESDFYFLTEDFTIIPSFRADHDKLHLEARYNYEDTKTVSLWGGYNFEFGKGVMFTVTPMAAPVLGNTNGIAPGLELTVSYGGFEFYSESEYVFNLDDESLNFFYDWSEISFAPFSWCSIGVAGQRTLVTGDDDEFQFGISAGLNYKSLSVYAYYFDIGSEDEFLMMSAVVSF